jgi:hypothetical protein
MQHVPTVVKPGPLYLVHSPENDVGLVGMTHAMGTYFGRKPECDVEQSVNAMLLFGKTGGEACGNALSDDALRNRAVLFRWPVTWG